MDFYKIAKEEYDQYIYLCNKSFAKSSSWWFVPSSSRERFGTNVQERYIEWVRKLSNPNELNSQEKWFKITFKKILVYKTFLYFIKILMLLFYHALKSFYKIVRNTKTDFDVVFVRPLHPLKVDFNEKNIFDHYFGELPKLMNQLQKKVIILGPADPSIEWESTLFEKKDLEISNLLKYFSFLSFLRWLFVSISEYFLRLKLPEPSSNYTKILYELISEEFRESYIRRLLGVAYYFSFTNFLKKNKKSIIFHTYENNPWERAIDRACQENFHLVQKNFGFLHCSILESHRKYRLLYDEWDLKPSPDTILVTGLNAKEILMKFGSYKEDHITIGYDLRGPNLFNIRDKNKLNGKIKTILVLLEGLNTMPKLLKLVMDTILNIPGKIILVRCHPVYPISNPEFNLIRENPLFQKVIVSSNVSLEEDLLKADLAIYKGSTSALYAAFMGIPLLRFQDTWWSSDDPLKYCTALKKEFNDSKSLLDGISFFEDMNFREYLSEKKIAKEYILEYMKPYRKSDLEKFAKDIVFSSK
ncbi:hypothetical protein [Leptospira kirschneri]|uniref:Uncharacterized protein n=1 Tax=Leptospira kirschneri serovar Bulgarica str. Nikolaevo TaxID=1240687 RepID=M6FR89_9LEPT|nr:hypothetical protein [Leptospira kirschneri]EMK25236.1 hypothetical protein LEP1GSC008_4513 [Leptospira kirschneri serovar Bulgarica str. Nikolaevo]